jgi:glycosyltransferase involved in cell wall biosynthesis
MARVLFLSTDVVGPVMAGPGIRAWELARALSRENSVTLAAPRTEIEAPPEFRLHAFEMGKAGALSEILAEHDVVIGQGLVFNAHPEVLASDLVLGIDLYDPELLESLHFENGQPFEHLSHEQHRYVSQMTTMLRRGDFFFCATERQRDYYLGALSALGRVNVPIYNQDQQLRSLIDLVPSGIAAEPPKASAPVLKGVHPAIAADDLVFLWAGGLWHWFEPDLLVRAAAELQAELPKLRICFFAGARPNPYGEPYRTPTAAQAHRLASELGVLNRSVVFLEDWVPYNERGAYLLESDVGVCSHLAGIETHFAFRTRLLDYIWSRMPIICSNEDSLSTEIVEAGAGLHVAIGDLEGWKNALRRMYHDADLRAEGRKAMETLAEQYQWQNVAQPLLRLCRNPQRSPDQQLMQALLRRLNSNDTSLQEQLAKQDAYIGQLQAAIEQKNQHIAQLEQLVQQIQNGRLMRILRRVTGK